MKKIFFFLTLTAFLFASCKKDVATAEDVGLNHIPQSASSVTTVNIKQLMEKADFETVKSMEFYQAMTAEMKKNDQEIVAAIAQDPSKSGVDLDKNAYVTYILDEKNPENVFTAIILNLNNESDFATLIGEANLTISDGDGYKKAANDRFQGMIAWNDNMAVIGIPMNRSVDVDARLTEIFTTTAETSIAQNADFTKTSKTNHDFTSWFTTDAIAKNPQAGFALSMIQIPATALEGNSIHSHFDFENGQVVGHSESFFNKDLGENFIGKFFKSKTETDFSNFIPGKDLVFATAGAIDFKGIDQFLSERPQAQGYVDFMLKNYGLTRADIVETFGGDFMMAGTGTATNNGSTLFATSIKDKSKLNSFLDLAIEANILQELETDVYKLMTVMPGLNFSNGSGFGQILIKEDLMFMTENETLIAQLKEGKLPADQRADNKVTRLLEDGTLGGYFDFEAVKSASKDLENINFEHLEFKVDGSESDFKMELEDKSKNALKAIFEMINRSYLESEAM